MYVGAIVALFDSPVSATGETPALNKTQNCLCVDLQLMSMCPVNSSVL